MARKFNLAPEQAQIYVNIPKPNPKQAQFLASTKLYTAFGGARGGGKSWVLRIKAFLGAVKYPGIKILVIRRTYPELQESIIEPLCQLVPPGIASYNGSAHMMYFANGSTIKFGHFQGFGDSTKYQGQEYDWIFMDEATHFTEMEFRVLGGCLRGVNKIPKRFYLTCNPGGVGHQWVKRLFIDKKYKTNSKNPEENENPKDYSFIFASVEDNKALLKSSPGYLQMLSSLPENMRRAHRYGDWDALAGAYFAEFDPAIHVCAPFQIPKDWARYRAFDYGLDMFAALWIAEDYDGRAYVYRELNESKLIVSEAAQRLHDNTLPQEQINITFAPPDMWSTQKDTGKTMAELFMLNDVGIFRANNNRVQGHLQIKERLKIWPDGKPGLLIFNDCEKIIENLQAIQADEKNPNDCAKEPHYISHNVDAIRYYAQSRTLPGEMAKEQEYIDDIQALDDYDEYMTGGEACDNYITY